MDDHLGRWHVNLKKVKAFLQDEGVTEVKDLLTNCIYLEDSMVNLYGINIYGVVECQISYKATSSSQYGWNYRG
jgi:hypothetical protein